MSESSYVPPCAEAVKQDIKRGNDSFMRCWKVNDFEALAKCYSEDCILMPAGMPPTFGREGVVQVFGGAYKAGAVNAELITEEVLPFKDDDTHFVERSKFKFSKEDGTAMMEGKYVVIWKRVNGELKMKIDVWNSDSA